MVVLLDVYLVTFQFKQLLHILQTPVEIVYFDNDLLDPGPIFRRNAVDNVKLAFLNVDLHQVDVIQLFFANYLRDGPEPAVVSLTLQSLVDQLASVAHDAVHSAHSLSPVSYTHLRAHETPEHLVCRLLLEK